ncbi:MAG: tetratricopeptide repeat protein [Thermodesulfobacteriota bacterium]
MTRAMAWRWRGWVLGGLMAGQLMGLGTAAAQPGPTEPPAAVAVGGEISAWQARWELARLLGFAKRYDEALAEYDRLLKERPGEPALRMEKARVLFWAGRSEQALRLFEQLPLEQLGEADRIAMADILVGLKEYERARAIYLDHLGRVPGDHGVRLKLAELLGWLKQYEAAIREYRRILEALPDDVQVRRKYAQVLAWAGQREEAIRQLQLSLGSPGK